jgi:hypothetical protein
MVDVKFKRNPLALVLLVLLFVTDIVPLNWLLLSSALLIATMSPVPTRDPTRTFDPPPEDDEEDDASAAFATEFVVPPFPDCP